MGSILSKGIGSLVLKEYTDWNRIKNIAKRNGIYTAAFQLHPLIYQRSCSSVPAYISIHIYSF